MITTSNSSSDALAKLCTWANEAIGTLMEAMKMDYLKGNFTDNGYTTQGWQTMTKYIYENATFMIKIKCF